MSQLISGIQQVGIGVPNADAAKVWYKHAFGMGAVVFDDKAEAKLMTKYTGGIVQSRHALMSINLAGGGCFEIWQYTSKKPVASAFKITYGDTGIFGVKMKSNNVEAFHKKLKEENQIKVSELFTDPVGEKHFWLRDVYGNSFQVIKGTHWLVKNGALKGGVSGAVICVRDIDKALKLYKDSLGINEIIYDKTGVFNDLPDAANSNQKFRRVLIRKNYAGVGAFSRLLGDITIELVQALEYEPKKIYQDRHWGDLGFVHLCFDVVNMNDLKIKCAEKGFPFTVDSADSFDMGVAAGRFSYCEDPDGTLIEFVETHKVPILKKLGWYFDLNKRGHHKPLRNWMVNMLGLNKIKG